MTELNYSGILEQRYYDLLIGYDFAKNSQGTDFPAYSQELSSLLAVDRQAKQSRDQVKQDIESRKEENRQKLNQQVTDLMGSHLFDVDHVYQNLLGIHEALPSILDLLAVRAATVTRLEPLVRSMRWLESDLIQFINLPGYRKENNGQPVKVENIRVALSFIGIENLKFVVPCLALKRWLPASTEPFRLLKRKIWEANLASAISGRRLAQMYEVDEACIFTASLFQGLGQIAVTKMYFRLFDEVRNKLLEEAREKVNKDDYGALLELEPDGDSLKNSLLKYSAKLSEQLIEKMQLKRLPINQVLTAVESSDVLDKFQIGLQAYHKGNAYSRYKMLHRHNLITPAEAKIFIRENKLKVRELKELNQLSLKRLNLRMESS